MAKKRYEFKPDREGPDLLSRFTLTKKQQQSLLKWSLYGIVLLLLSVLQDCILYDMRIFGSTTDLVPCAIIAICVLEGATESSTFALAASFLFYATGSSGGVYAIPVLTFCALGAAIFRQNFLQKGFAATLLCTGVATVLYEMTAFTIALVLGQTYAGRFTVILTMSVLSTAAISLLYKIFIAIGKIGGDSWKE
jgi:hypothetical protein